MGSNPEAEYPSVFKGWQWCQSSRTLRWRMLQIFTVRRLVAVNGTPMVCLDALSNRKDTRCIMSVIHPCSKMENSFLVICFFHLLALPSMLASPKCLKVGWAAFINWKPPLCAAKLGGRECWILMGTWSWIPECLKFCPFLQLWDYLVEPKTSETQIRAGKRELAEVLVLWETGLWSENGAGTWTGSGVEQRLLPSLWVLVGAFAISPKRGPKAASLE